MEKGNVLVIGTSGVGKSTLINAVFDDEVAKTDTGTKGTTEKLEIYESKSNIVPFRIIDSVGFEPNWWKRHQAVNAVKKWSKDCAKDGKKDNQINVIWFCVDGTSSKLFDEDIKSMRKAVSMWKSVPIIAVITKSYSLPEQEKNIDLIKGAFDKDQKPQAIIPVVAKEYYLNDTAYAPRAGIEELIEKTNELMPEGLQAARTDLAGYVLNRKRVIAQSVVTAATASCAVVGAMPNITATPILGAIELEEVRSIARVYGIRNDEKSKEIINAIIEVGTVGTVAKATVSTLLKLIPGVGAIYAIVAGFFAATLGEGTAYVFEQVYLGNKDASDIDWVKKVIENKLTLKFVDEIKNALSTLSENPDKKEILNAIGRIIATMKENSPDKVESK